MKTTTHERTMMATKKSACVLMPGAAVLVLCLAPAPAMAQDCCTDHLGCQDGIWCTGIEYCSCWGACVWGTAPRCDDGDPCTMDACIDEIIDPPGLGYGTGYCMHTNICHGCLDDGDCADGDTCTVDTCSSGACINAWLPGCCHTDTDCDDGELCTTDACTAGACTNTPVTNCCHVDTDCDDSDPCTDDVCNSSHNCVNTPLSSCCETDDDCDDGDNCTRERCRTDGTCETFWTGAAGVNCCNVDGDCGDGLDCNGWETCDTSTLPEGECTDSTAMTCDDGFDCTVDACDESATWCPTPPDFCLCTHTGTSMFDDCSTAGILLQVGSGDGLDWFSSGDTHCSSDDYAPSCAASGIDNIHSMSVPTDGGSNHRLYAYHGMVVAADMDPTVCLFPVDECGTTLNWACNATGVGSCYIAGHAPADGNDACFETYSWSSARTVLPEGAYSIMVDSANVSGGNYDVYVSREPVSNDTCSEAVELQMGGRWFGTTSGHASNGCAFCTENPTTPTVGTSGACSSYTCLENYPQAEFELNHTAAPWNRDMGYVIKAVGVAGFDPALSLLKNRCSTNMSTSLSSVAGVACSNDMDATTAPRIVTGIIPSGYVAELRLHGYAEFAEGEYELTVLYDSDGDGLDDAVDLWPSDMWGANPSPPGDYADGPIPVDAVPYTDTRTSAGYPRDGLNDTGIIVDTGLGAEEVYYRLNTGSTVTVRVAPLARSDAWSGGGIPEGWNVVLWYSDNCTDWSFEDAGGASEGEEVTGVSGYGCIAVDGFDDANQGHYILEVS